MHVHIRIFIENDFFTQIVAVMPPSAMNIPPVQNDASSEARKATKLAISSFLPHRCIGIFCSNAVLTALGSSGFREIARSFIIRLSIGPGAATLIRIPELASSAAPALTKSFYAGLDAI